MKRPMATAFRVLPIALLVGCYGERAGDGTAEGEAGMEMAAVEYSLEITNPMPHDMMVFAEAGTRVIELGTVPANQTATFTIMESEAIEVGLRATDVDRTHSPAGTVKLMKGQAATWTIGQ